MRVSSRVAFRFAKEFSSEKALKEYLEKHPKADPKKHSIAEKPKIEVDPELHEEFREALPEYHLEIVAGGDRELEEADVERAKEIAKKVKEGIQAAADVCKMSPPVCEGNLGIGRDNMPQIMDKPIKELLKSKDPKEKAKGEAAVEAGADPKSDKSMKDILLDSLRESGVKIKKEKVPVGQLKATQKEIQADKTFDMADSHLKGKYDPSKEQIIVSNDNHILDGHHRWAALLTASPDRKMEVIRVDMPMREFLEQSFKQPGVFRADLQGNIIPKDRPIDLSGDSGEKPKEKPKKKTKKALLVNRIVERHLRGF